MSDLKAVGNRIVVYGAAGGGGGSLCAAGFGRWRLLFCRLGNDFTELITYLKQRSATGEVSRGAS